MNLQLISKAKQSKAKQSKANNFLLERGISDALIFLNFLLTDLVSFET